MSNCLICEEAAHRQLGGVMLCALHYAAVREEIDALRSSGQETVNIARIAYRLRLGDDDSTLRPSAEAVHAYLKRHGITGAQAARMMYLSGSRQVRKYTGGASPRQMDGARWFCLHAHTMLPPETIAEIERVMEFSAADTGD